MKEMNLEKTQSFQTRESGFTLIETAIVLVIGGILMAALTTGVLNFVQERKVDTTAERIAKVDKSIREYLEANGHLPCAANRTIDSTNGLYGIALPLAQCLTAPGPATGTARNGGVRIGMVPTRELGLPDEYGYDGWGSRFIYAVTEVLVDPATYDSRNGAIIIIDRNGGSAITPANTGNFIVVSPGPDRKGGFTTTATAAPVTACGSPIAAGQMDEENCDDDRTFRVSQNYLRNDVTGYYDDVVSYMGVELPLEELPEGAVVAFTGACPDNWREMQETNGRFIIGVGRYTHQTFPMPVTMTGYPNTQKGSGTWLTNTLGGGLSQYINLPPYIASRYCIRDTPNNATGGSWSAGVRTFGGAYDYRQPITIP